MCRQMTVSLRDTVFWQCLTLLGPDAKSEKSIFEMKSGVTFWSHDSMEFLLTYLDMLTVS